MFGDEDSNATEINFDRVLEGHLPTGVKKLDEEQPQGFPKGSTVVIMGDERTMTNLFGLHLASTGRPTQYVTTLRPANLVREDVNKIAPHRSEEIDENLTIEDFFRGNDDHREALKVQLDRVPEGGNLVVESFSELNWPDKASARKTMRKIYRVIRNKKEGLAMFHLQKSRVSDLTDLEREVLNLADIVIHVTSEKVGGDLEHDMKLYKMRGVNKMPEQVFKLKFGDSIRIDSARDI